MIGLLLAGCAVELEPGPLGHVEAWEALPPSEDPLPEHRPDEVSCAPGGWFVEDGRIEVQTGICDYVTLGQPLLREVREGDLVRVLAWHQGLDAAEPAEAHIALFVDGVRLWEAWAPIPSEATIFSETVAAPVDAPMGAPVILHLHNHGFNAWAVDVPERL